MRFASFAILALVIAVPARAASVDQAFADAVFFCAASMAPKMWFETSGYVPTSGKWMEKSFGAAKVSVLPKGDCQAMLHGRPEDPAAVEAALDKKLSQLPSQFEASAWIWTPLDQGLGYDRKTFLQRQGRDATKLYLSRTPLAFGKPASVTTSYVATVRRFTAFGHIGMNGPVGAAVTDGLSNCARATSKSTLSILARAMGYEERDRDEHTLRVLDDAKLMTFYSAYDNSCSVYVTSEEASV